MFIFSLTTKTKQNRLEAVWSVREVNATTDWTDATKTSTGFNQPNLVINGLQLKEGTFYKFRLMIGFKGSISKNKYTFVKETSITPNSGSCSVK